MYLGYWLQKKEKPCFKQMLFFLIILMDPDIPNPQKLTKVEIQMAQKLSLCQKGYLVHKL